MVHLLCRRNWNIDESCEEGETSMLKLARTFHVQGTNADASKVRLKVSNVGVITQLEGFELEAEQRVIIYAI